MTRVAVVYSTGKIIRAQYFFFDCIFETVYYKCKQLILKKLKKKHIYNQKHWHYFTYDNTN